MLEALDPVPACLAVIKKLLEQYSLGGPATGWMIVSQLRVRITREKKGVLNYQLSSYMEPADRHKVEVAIHEAIVALGGEIRPGPAPASQAERQIQKQIDDLKATLPAPAGPRK